jgi:hypothetical protein
MKAAAMEVFTVFMMCTPLLIKHRYVSVEDDTYTVVVAC